MIEDIVTTLKQDPVGCYAKMDFASRDQYRVQIAKIALRSDKDEMDIARAVLALAKLAHEQKFLDQRVHERESHIGYYLVDDGKRQLYDKVGYRPTFTERIKSLIRSHSNKFFLGGIGILTFLTVSITVLLMSQSSLTPGLLLFAILLLLFPSSQSAVQVINFLVTAVLPASCLPKLDFSQGVPDDCVTLVVIPSLLLNEKQVRTLVDDLEVRFLGNRDPNIHFALLTDLPDSKEPASKESPLIDLCAKLIYELNKRYAGQKQGTFFLFHRHRVYNPHERVWMGWERKRGKLLNLNQLLCSTFDSFPVKIGDLSIIPNVSFVITLDEDTEMPRGVAHRMVGALAHPLNRAILDPDKNIVTKGYGILQPRVDVSIKSTVRSRLAAIYAGETGFDIYTRAVSNAYQDLYGEGIFAGKGIYEVSTVHRVFNHRFPHNVLLSHDLIEGAYARAGLASDIQLIEDYPLHYSAYNRRKHRWLRGDWQIIDWLFPNVRNEAGKKVPNPLSLTSRWKIFDNLRRSLVEPAIFTLFLFGWLLGEEPWKWMLVPICILLIPTFCELFDNLVRSIVKRDALIARDSLGNLFSSLRSVFLTVTFLAHQTLIVFDAVIRTLFRRFLTHHHLLEWETAAEAGASANRRTHIDIYFNWIPVLALAIASLVYFVHPAALSQALPIIFVWGASPFIASWLNQPSITLRSQVSRKDILFLRSIALYTWRYFAEFSTEEHNWLIPDNFREDPPTIAARVSPTNLGLLLNARQVACEFGYLTAPEYARHTRLSLDTYAKHAKKFGHPLNWYDTRTLEVLPPLFVSSVDNGNLVASLWTLEQGTRERLRLPILEPALADGVLDYLRILAKRHAFSQKRIAHCERECKTSHWLQFLLSLPLRDLEEAQSMLASSKNPQDTWFATQACILLREIENTVRSYVPWCLPEFEHLREDHTLNLPVQDTLAIDQLPRYLKNLEQSLDQIITTGTFEPDALQVRLRDLLPAARANINTLIDQLNHIADLAEQFSEDMDFSTLLDQRRKILSVGYDVQARKLHATCFDLLASEARTGAFVAIAKEDIPQETWYQLGRAHTLDQGNPVMLSWTGTMFEYLMPALWMRSYANTLLGRTQFNVVASQKAYALEKRIPWGISESSSYEVDEAGNYSYRVFGIPNVALHKLEHNSLVISPYSTFLALSIAPTVAITNLRRMYDLGWFGTYGFYESADFTRGLSAPRSGRLEGRALPCPQLVRCWMAHHQGMSLLAIANLLQENVIQHWFHANRRVQATEFLLQEKPVGHVHKKDL
jgi:cyclic beta-1,2-glucan synthetase